MAPKHFSYLGYRYIPFDLLFHSPLLPELASLSVSQYFVSYKTFRRADSGDYFRMKAAAKHSFFDDIASTLEQD